MRILPFKHYIPTIKAVFKNSLRGQSIFPYYASFKITGKCHFGCPFCNMKQNRTVDLTTDEIKKILDNISRSSVLLTSFEGGDPLLRPDIVELVQYARTCNFYLLFTTSEKNLLSYPVEHLVPYIDFLHISIDEGHNNIEMFELLPQLKKLQTIVSVQTVVTHNSISELEWKVEKCYKSGIHIVIIPATIMNNAQNCFPDIGVLKSKIVQLKRKYPSTIHTPIGYFDAYANKKCSAASIIIAPDGYLYYPCHILEQKTANLIHEDLNQWLVSQRAFLYRDQMKKCIKNCGWYQYYSIESYCNPFFLLSNSKLFKG